jgi:hypothetical protein
LNPYQARRRTLSKVLPLYKATDKVGGSLLFSRKTLAAYEKYLYGKDGDMSKKSFPK